MPPCSSPSSPTTHPSAASYGLTPSRSGAFTSLRSLRLPPLRSSAAVAPTHSVPFRHLRSFSCVLSNYVLWCFVVAALSCGLVGGSVPCCVWVLGFLLRASHAIMFVLVRFRGFCFARFFCFCFLWGFFGRFLWFSRSWRCCFCCLGCSASFCAFWCEGFGRLCAWGRCAGAWVFRFFSVAAGVLRCLGSVRLWAFRLCPSFLPLCWLRGSWFPWFAGGSPFCSCSPPLWSLLLVLFVVVVLVPGVRLPLPLVVVVGCCSGCPLVFVLPLGLGCPGLRLVLWVLLVVGGLVFPLLFRRSCLFSSCSLGGFVPFLFLPRSLFSLLLANL